MGNVNTTILLYYKYFSKLLNGSVLLNLQRPYAINVTGVKDKGGRKKWMREKKGAEEQEQERTRRGSNKRKGRQKTKDRERDMKGKEKPRGGGE